jgi:hypothetical protein
MFLVGIPRIILIYTYNTLKEERGACGHGALASALYTVLTNAYSRMPQLTLLG